MKLRLPTHLLAALLLATLMQSCFITGVESTSKITAKDVKRAEATVLTPEQQFAERLCPDPVQQWRKGHQVMITDRRFSLLLDGTANDINAGDTLRFEEIVPRLTFTGDTLSTIRFTHQRSGRALYLPLELNVDRSSAAQIALPFAVDLEAVARADSAMRGKTYYIISRLRVDENNAPTANGPRYIAATVDSVVPGCDPYPLTVIFTDALGNHGRAAMTVGSGNSGAGAATRNFNTLFTFADPRLRYPDITEQTWQRIVNGTVAEGMTTSECRLSLGAPRDVSKSQNGAVYTERWTYDNGSYLVFIDGLLSSFRL